jgi:hypothetical protein
METNSGDAALVAPCVGEAKNTVDVATSGTVAGQPEASTVAEGKSHGVSSTAHVVAAPFDNEDRRASCSGGAGSAERPATGHSQLVAEKYVTTSEPAREREAQAQTTPRNGPESAAMERDSLTIDGAQAAGAPENVASCPPDVEMSFQEDEDMEHRPTVPLRSPATKIAMRLGDQTVFLPALPTSPPRSPRSKQMPHVQTLKVLGNASHGGSSSVAAAFKLANQASPRRLALPLHSLASKVPQANTPGTPFPLSPPQASLLLATNSGKARLNDSQGSLSNTLNGTQGSLPDDISFVYAPVANRRRSHHTVNLMLPADQPTSARQEKPRTLRLKVARSSSSTEA